MKYNKGFTPLVLLAIIAGALIIGGGAYYLGKSSNVENKEVVETQNQIQNNINESNLHEVPTGPFLDENTYIAPEPICNTNSSPWLKIISPKGGESYKIGDSLILSWKSCNLLKETPITGELMDIINPTGSDSNSRSLFCEGTDNSNDLKNSDCLNSGSRIIQLSGNILPGTYKIKISSSLRKPFVEGISDKTFTINSKTYTYKNHGVTFELPSGYVPHEEKAEGGPAILIYLPNDNHLSYITDASFWEKWNIPQYKYMKDEKIGETTFKVYTSGGITIYYFKQGNVAYEYSGDKSFLNTFKFVGWN